MPLDTDTLRAAAGRAPDVAVRTLTEARTVGAKTAFLCHSHRDAELAKGLANLLAEAGWRVYIDWQDTEMPSTPNRITASRIKQRIVDLDYFLILATSHSLASRWCPWELGYADGKKHIDQILLIPTRDGTTTHGNEYLQLYRRIDRSNQGPLAVWQPDQDTGGVFVRDL